MVNTVRDSRIQKIACLAAIGCTGEIGAIYVREILEMGFTLRLLARSPERFVAHYPANFLTIQNTRATTPNRSAALLLSGSGNGPATALSLIPKKGQKITITGTGTLTDRSKSNPRTLWEYSLPYRNWSVTG